MLAGCTKNNHDEIAAHNLPGVTGRVDRYHLFESQYVDARHVDVWVPPGYNQNNAERFPVIYMHDGQNLFDPAASSSGVDWGVDETVTRLMAEDKRFAVLVVAIWNTPKRRPEYMPQKALEYASPQIVEALIAEEGEPKADDYLKFIVHELKPKIDATYRTRPDAAHTFIMGSSMGGLISIYALCEYPRVFGGAGCLSSHWPAGNGIVIHYLKDHLPAPGRHRLYFDFGTETLDAQYEPYQLQVDSLMQDNGYRSGEDWLTRKFPGHDHSERSWRARLHIPIRFLLQGML